MHRRKVTVPAKTADGKVISITFEVEGDQLFAKLDNGTKVALYGGRGKPWKRLHPDWIVTGHPLEPDGVCVHHANRH